MNRSNKKIKVAIFLIMSLVMMPVGFSVGLDVEQNVKIGILMINHGEPAEYNATTYEDFKEFTQHMINVGIIPRFLMNIDTGTILIDEKNDHWAPFWKRSLIDAWGNRYKGFAFFEVVEKIRMNKEIAM